MRKILCLNDEQLLCLIPKLPRDRILEISLKLPFPMLHLLHKQLSDQQIKEVYLCHYNAQAGTIDFEDTPDSFTELRLASAGLYLGQRNFRLALLTAYDILWHKGGKEKILALLEDWREMGTTSRELANIIQQLKSGSQMWTVFLTLPESCRVAIQPFLREDNVELMVKAQDHLIRSRYHYIPKEASTERPWEERLICGVITAKLLSQSKDYKPE